MARNPRPVDDDDHMSRAMQTLEQERSGGPLGPQVVMNERTVFGDIITAQPIKVPRNMANVLREIDITAGAAGDNWYYRFPVKKKGGGIDYIEGPTIDAADAVARIYGNCQVQTVLASETPTQWVFASRFVDLQTGYSLIRPFLQPKRSTLGGDDEERRLQQAWGIGTSKCQRNVVDHALRDFMERAFKTARANLVERIGKHLLTSRARIIERIKAIGGDELLARVVQVYQRKPEEWLAPDIARLHAEAKAVEDGMALPDEVWPVAAPEPKRSDVTDVEDTSAAAVDVPGEHGGAATQQASLSPEATPTSASPTSTDALQRSATLNSDKP
jgi:hypothetical protein